MREIVLAMTGASGMPYGIRALEVLAKTPDVRVHLVMSAMAEKLLAFETDRTPAELARLAWKTHAPDDFFAPVASGSHAFAGMLVCPASMKFVGLAANGIGSDLIARTADVCLKERRTLVVVPRETPLSLIHLRNLTTLAEAGAVILPPTPGFYHRPKTLDDAIDHVVGKALDCFGIAHRLYPEWKPEPEE
ncbi:MAG: UbiX family flavin prenyltransferase [Thermoplasmatota archaeon]